MKIKNPFKPRKEGLQIRAKDTIGIIMEATAHILDKTELSKISTNKIAEKAGVSIGSLYQYFPSKESIFFKFIESKLDEEYLLFVEEIRNQEYDDLELFIADCLEFMFSRTEKHQKVRQLLFYFIPRGLSPSIYAIEDKIKVDLAKKFESFPQINLSNKDLQMKTHIIIHSTIGVIHSDLPQNREMDKDHARELLQEMIIKFLK